jgi:ribosomal-protein-alanine N-acetyltransferase
MKASGAAVVDTPRLRLRPVHPADAAETARMMTPSVSRWLASWPSPMTEAAVAARIERITTATAEGHALAFAIERREDGVMMGWVTVTRAHGHPSRGDLGYWLGEPFHGRGYMREAAGAAVPEAFARLGMTAIEAGAHPDNEASLRVMRGLGMRAIGTRAVWASARGREEVCEFYEITRDESGARDSH